MELTENELLTGETVVLSKLANAVLALDEYGLSEFAFGQLLPLVGMRGKEAIGGKLHLTNYRLVFKSHNWNRLCGTFSVLLPTITNLADVSFLILKKMQVRTQTQKLEYVVWGIPHLMAAIAQQQALLQGTALEQMKHIASQEYAKCGNGLQLIPTLETLNMAFLAGQKLTDFTQLVRNPLELSNLLNVIEMFYPIERPETDDEPVKLPRVA